MSGTGTPMARRRLAAAALICAVSIPVATAAGTDERHLPNITPRITDIGIGLVDEPHQGDRALRFAVRAVNVGGYALDVLGVPATPREALAMQCVRWSGYACVDRVTAGTFVFHPQHGHWHFDGYGLYQLRALLPDGTPDMSPAGLVADGGKVSFCLMDSARDHGSSAGLYKACLGVLQGISAGWMDIYGAYLYGQQIPLLGVPDGDYALTVALNPDAVLLETSFDDNSTFKRVRIAGSGTSVEILP